HFLKNRHPKQYRSSALLLTALLSPAVPAQKIPRVNAAGVPVVPVKDHSVVTRGFHAIGSGRRLVHRKKQCGSRLAFARRKTGSFARFVARRAGAGIPQPAEAPRAPVAVLPIDLHAGAFAFVDAHLRGIDRLARKRRTVSAARLSFIDDANAFVTHDVSPFQDTRRKKYAAMPRPRTTTIGRMMRALNRRE